MRTSHLSVSICSSFSLAHRDWAPNFTIPTTRFSGLCSGFRSVHGDYRAWWLDYMGLDRLFSASIRKHWWKMGPWARRIAPWSQMWLVFGGCLLHLDNAMLNSVSLSLTVAWITMSWVNEVTTVPGMLFLTSFAFGQTGKDAAEYYQLHTQDQSNPESLHQSSYNLFTPIRHWRSSPTSLYLQLY